MSSTEKLRNLTIKTDNLPSKDAVFKGKFSRYQIIKYTCTRNGAQAQHTQQNFIFSFNLCLIVCLDPVILLDLLRISEMFFV